MTSESKADGQMGCAMTNCKLAQCIRSQSDDTIITTITDGTHSKPDNGRYFYFSSMYVARVLSGAEMRRVHDDQAQQWRASMILWSCRDVQIQCTLQKLRRQRSFAIIAVWVPPSREKGRRSTASLSSDTEEGL